MLVPDETKHIQYLTNESLVSRCLEGHNAAWNEFFRRFTLGITQKIYHVLKQHGYRLTDGEDEPVGDVREHIIVKLRHRGQLSKCTDPAGLENWLQTVAGNQTLDWIREQHRMKAGPKNDSENNQLSLDEPVGENDGPRFGDILFFDKEQCDGGGFLDAILRSMNEMERNELYWVLRLSIIAQDALNEEECADLAAFAERPFEQTKEALAIVMKRLAERIIRKETVGARAVILWHKLRRMERTLRDPFSNLSETDRKELEAKMVSVERLRHEHLKAANIDCRPSNKEIADLLGLPKRKVGQISVMLLRARGKLRKNCGRASP